nr:cecropin analog S1 [synthetic construct]
MNFSRIFFFVFALVLALSTVSAAPDMPRWRLFRRIDRVGKQIKQGILRAGPAIALVGDARAVG